MFLESDICKPPVFGMVQIAYHSCTEMR